MRINYCSLLSTHDWIKIIYIGQSVNALHAKVCRIDSRPFVFFQILSDELVSKGAQTSLLSHPLITSVTPQRRVTRSLTSVTVDDDEADFEEEAEAHHDEEEEVEDADGIERWTRGRRSLAFGEFSIHQNFLSFKCLTS